MSHDGLQEGKKRADTDPELLLFPTSTTTAGAIFCYYARTLFSFTSLCFLLNKQLATTTTHIFREKGKWASSVFNTIQLPNAFFLIFFPLNCTGSIIRFGGQSIFQKDTKYHTRFMWSFSSNSRKKLRSQPLSRPASRLCPRS